MSYIVLVVFFLIGYKIGKYNAILTTQDIEEIKKIMPHKKAKLLKKKEPLTHAEQVLKDLEK